jgi:hypothetical protein
MNFPLQGFMLLAPDKCIYRGLHQRKYSNDAMAALVTFTLQQCESISQILLKISQLLTLFLESISLRVERISQLFSSGELMKLSWTVFVSMVVLFGGQADSRLSIVSSIFLT